MPRKTKYPVRFYQKHGSFFFVSKDNKWHNLGKDYYEALRKYADLNTTCVVQGTLSEVIDRYTRDILPTKAMATQRQRRPLLDTLKQTFGHMRPDDINPPHIYAFMDAYGSRKAMANRAKSVLSHVFQHAIRWGLATHNPCRLTENFKEKPRDRYVTDTEFWQIYDVAPEYIQRAMSIAVITGLRVADIIALHRDNVRPEGLLVQPAKTRDNTGKRLLFRWTPELRSLIGEPTSYVLLYSNGEHANYEGLHATWQRLQRKVFPNKADRYTFHDLRAKAGSDSDTGALLGHADRRTLERHYRRKPQVLEPLVLPQS